MDIIVYEDDTGEVVVAEKDRNWGEFKKYRKGKFPHILYVILSFIASVIVFIYLDLFTAILTAIVLFVILAIIIEIFGQKFFNIEEFKDKFKISKGDVIISYGEVFKYLSCYVVLTDKTNLLILSESASSKIGIYISENTHKFDKNLYSYGPIYEDINTGILELFRSAFPSSEKTSDFYHFGDMRNHILSRLIKIYKEHVKDM